MQSNYGFNVGTFGHWLSELRKIGALFGDFKLVERILIGFHNFQTLSHCELITDDGIRQLAAGSCAAESLSVLELDNCPLITDQTLEHLVSCHNLQRIELYDCQMITRAAIRRLRVSLFAHFQTFLIIWISNRSIY